MDKIKTPFYFSFFIIFIFNSVFCSAQGDYVLLKADDKDWQVNISPYMLMAGNSTDVGGTKIRQNFNDLTSITNFGFQLVASVQYKKFVLSADGTYANLKTSVVNGPISIDLNIDQYILDSKIGYIIYSVSDYSQTEEVIRGWSIEANIGGKYWKNDVGLNWAIDFPNNPLEGQIKEPQSWTDLMIGTKARIILNKRVVLGLSGDIGGFGIGNSSDFAWDFTFVNSFKLTNLIYITAGYRTMKYSRTDGEGDSELKTNVSVFGPLLGVTFSL